jgi:hypothetical protein
MKKWLTAIALLGASTALLAANYANEVMAIGVGARALGMGGAFVALADDSTATYWNAAGLPGIKHFDFDFVQQGNGALSSGLNDVDSQYMFISGGMNLGDDIGALGVGFLRYGVKDIPYVPVQVVNAGDAPVTNGTFDTQDLGLMLAYGRKITQGLNLGLGFKYLHGGTVNLPGGDATYSDSGLDLGVLIKFGEWTRSLRGLNLGLTVQDLYNSGVTWVNTPTDPTDSVGTNVKLGLSYTPDFDFLKLSKSKWNMVVVDLDTKYSPVMLLHYGSEFWYKDTVGLRAGARSFLGSNDNGGDSYQQGTEVSMGLSVRVLFLTVDYSYVNYELTPMQYLNMGVTF